MYFFVVQLIILAILKDPPFFDRIYIPVVENYIFGSNLALFGLLQCEP